MGDRRLLRVPVMMILIAAVVIATAVGMFVQQQGAINNSGDRRIQTDLLNHNKNDGKDGCPNDGNAGKGNDNKGPNGGCREHPPTGGYGKPKGKP